MCSLLSTTVPFKIPHITLQNQKFNQNLCTSFDAIRTLSTQLTLQCFQVLHTGMVLLLLRQQQKALINKGVKEFHVTAQYYTITIRIVSVFGQEISFNRGSIVKEDSFHCSFCFYEPQSSNILQ